MFQEQRVLSRVEIQAGGSDISHPASAPILLTGNPVLLHEPGRVSCVPPKGTDRSRRPRKKKVTPAAVVYSASDVAGPRLAVVSLAPLLMPFSGGLRCSYDCPVLPLPLRGLGLKGPPLARDCVQLISEHPTLSRVELG